MSFHIPDMSGLLLVYMLVFARTGAMIMLLPAIGDSTVPPKVRLALALAISFALTPAVAHFYPAIATGDMMRLGMLLAEEVTAGLLVGAMARIIMSTLHVAGYVIATQTGLAYSQAINPSFGGESPTIGNFITMLGTVMIFATNLHHLAIAAIAGSYTLIPPGGALPTADMAQLTINLVSGSFALGLQLAAPFIVFSFAISAAIGLLARLMPQVQVFFVAMPVNMLMGFFVMMLLLGSMMTLFLHYFAAQMAHFG
jgi:flagellar biosynthetic protein FliR